MFGVRITTRRYLASIPMTMVELQADKDRLRAEFAMETRRFEMRVEELQGKIASQLSHLGRQTAEIRGLKVELGKKTVAILALEAREQARKSMLERIVKLLAFLFVRPRRRFLPIALKAAPDRTRD